MVDSANSGKWPLHVLLVEDEKVNRMVLSILLSRYVTEVTEASDGVEALEMIESSPPDVLITDLTMPRLDGRGLIDALRAEHKLPKTIVLTAHHQSEFMDVPGPDGYRVLYKPLKVNLLTQMLDTIADELKVVRA